MSVVDIKDLIDFRELGIGIVKIYYLS